MTGLVLIHGLFFSFFPVVYPRNYDINSLSWISQMALSCDQPQNCFPSLHVSFVVLTLLMTPILGLSKKIKSLFIIWGVIIISSTILVKQHYIIDVLAGIVLTMIYFAFYKASQKLTREP